MTKDKAKLIMERLAAVYPDAKPELKYKTAFELLIAVILSAQCTDKRVNIVTDELFKEYNTPQKILSLGEEGLAEMIKSCGLYKSKAAHILSATEDIIKKFGGEVPEDLESLRTLAGVGRKTANVVYSVAFGGDAIAVDTHVFRVSNRIGLVREKDVYKTELALMEILEKKSWRKAHHYLIYLGRSFCKAARPDCENCPINDICEKHIKE